MSFPKPRAECPRCHRFYNVTHNGYGRVRIHKCLEGEAVGIQFNALEGAREFTDDDRRKVLKVLADVVHEIQDAHRLDGMFEPYAEIVHMVLTDDRIAQNFKDARAEEVRGRHAYGGPQGVSKPIAREEWGAARES